jgi:hypothetical protein
MAKHLEHLSIERRSNRADAAPKLAVAQQTRRDAWRNRAGELSRAHERPRRELFTPTRVEGEPPAARLASTRRTVGRYCDTGECFTVVDEWRNRKTAHRDLGRWWTGHTVFMLRQ